MSERVVVRPFTALRPEHTVTALLQHPPVFNPRCRVVVRLRVEGEVDYTNSIGNIDSARVAILNNL